jgi:hypothetical protein
LSQRKSGNRSNEKEAEAKPERKPVTPEAVFAFRLNIKFRPPIKMSCLQNFEERVRKTFYFHGTEENIAKTLQKFAIVMQCAQRRLETSLLLSSLWAGVALTMVLLFLVIIIGVR